MVGRELLLLASTCEVGEDCSDDARQRRLADPCFEQFLAGFRAEATVVRRSIKKLSDGKSIQAVYYIDIDCVVEGDAFLRSLHDRACRRGGWDNRMKRANGDWNRSRRDRFAHGC